jgi:succinate dehydrogenase flavin-adding protein (antitoxin of CptAB toxin-antitoxin module)
MKELDLLLEDYLTRHFSGAPPAEQHAFATLVRLPDAVLLAYVMNRQQPETEVERRVVARLRRTPRT